MDKPLISVIIPVYRVEAYLDRCLETVIHQTYRNLEIILVDDGSPDRCPQLCDAWAKRDHRIRVIHKPNGGLSDARNCGLRGASGVYVAFVDSDDWLSLVMLERLQEAMEAYRVDMVSCSFVHVYPNGGQIEPQPEPFPPELLSPQAAMERLLENTRLTNPVWCKLYRRALVPDDAFPVGRCHEDVYAMHKLILNCKTVLCLSSTYYFYRENPDGISKSPNLQVIRDHLEGFQARHDALSKRFPALREAILRAQLGAISCIWQELKRNWDRSPERNRLRASLLRELDGVRLDQLSHLFPGGRLRKAELVLLKLCPWLDEPLDRLLFGEHAPGYRFLRAVRDTVRGVKTACSLARERPRGTKTFWVFCTPSHGNLGDRALTLAEEQFIRYFFPDLRVCLVPLERVGRLTARLLARLVLPGDFCAIQAGGNIGTLYPSTHAVQEHMIAALRRKRLVIFPQTFYFSQNTSGKQVLQRTQKVYSRCKNLCIFAREQVSYDFLRENFPGTKCALAPDMALFLPAYPSAKVRSGALLAIRIDGERILTDHTYGVLLNLLERRFPRVEDIDTHLYRDLTEAQAREALVGLWARMAGAQVVVTDQLHGMLFAAITQTPCVLLPGRSHKLEGVYRWVEPLPYIQFARSETELEGALDRVLSVKGPVYSLDQVRESFREMAQMIQQQ